MDGICLIDMAEIYKFLLTYEDSKKPRAIRNTIEKTELSGQTIKIQGVAKMAPKL